MSDANTTKQAQSIISKEFIAIEPKYDKRFPKIYLYREISGATAF